MALQIKLVKPNVSAITKNENGSYNLYSAKKAIIEVGETININTGVIVNLPENYMMLILNSHLAMARNINVNSEPIIDDDMSITVRLTNNGDAHYNISLGSVVAKMVLIPYINPDVVIVNNFNENNVKTKEFPKTAATWFKNNYITNQESIQKYLNPDLIAQINLTKTSAEYTAIADDKKTKYLATKIYQMLPKPTKKAIQDDFGKCLEDLMKSK